jgi:hypothetical protein
MSTSNAYEQFVNDERGYLRWLEENPRGYVVNSFRSPTSNYLKLHRASCKHINKGFENNWTTGDFIKTCSTDPAALDDWAKTATGSGVDPCGACKPVLRPNSGSSASRPEPIAVKSPLASATAKQTPVVPPPSEGKKSLPPEILTGCPELDLAWKTYATMILHRSQILIPDTDDDLTWHAFLGHSIDMQGFRAAEFVGVDLLTRKAPKFVPLKARGLGVPQLAALWEIPEIKSHLLRGIKGVPLGDTLDVLRSHGGGVGVSLAEAFEHFPWRKFHWSVRALLQNSAVLKPFAFSFRRWLENEYALLGVRQFPPANFRHAVTLGGAAIPLERALRDRLQKTFYKVGPAMSAYMLCDWQLWLWREGRTAVFATFKLDSFHEAFVKKFGRGVIPADEDGFARWWHGLFPELPPRLANECIWLAVEDKQVDIQ